MNSTREDDRIKEYDQIESLIFSHCLSHRMSKLVELYREADTSVKKKAMEILKENQPVTELQGTIESLIDGAIGLFSGR